MPANRRLSHTQNFLRRPELVDFLLDRSGITPDDLVVEIGPGRGIITDRLARRCRHVLAVEKDPELGQVLQRRFAGEPNVAVFAADFLDFPLPVTPYRVFANIPFNVTTAIIAKLTSGSSPPRDAWLVVQEEAAMRVLGEPVETLFAVSLKPVFAPAIVHRFRAADFVPRPGVNTVLLHLHRRDHPLLPPSDLTRFLDFVSFVFAAWRPSVREALAELVPRAALTRLEQSAGVGLRRPPSGLPFPDWLALFAAFRSVAGEAAWAKAAEARARLLNQQARLEKPTRAPLATRREQNAAARGDRPPARTALPRRDGRRSR